MLNPIAHLRMIATGASSGTDGHAGSQRRTSALDELFRRIDEDLAGLE